MGSVYLARDPSLDRLVAVKTVRELDLQTDQKKRFLERFRNEAKAAARLADPTIVQVYDVGEDAGIGGPFRSSFFTVSFTPYSSSGREMTNRRGKVRPLSVW